MKKLLYFLLCLALTLASCSRPEPVNEPEPDTEDLSSLPIWRSGSRYRIVYHAEEDDNKVLCHFERLHAFKIIGNKLLHWHTVLAS